MQQAIAILAITLLLAGCTGKAGETKVTDAAKLVGKHYEITCSFTTDAKGDGLHAEFTACKDGALKDAKVEEAAAAFNGMDDSTSAGMASKPGGEVIVTVYYPSPNGNSLPVSDYYVVNQGGEGAFSVLVSFPVDPQGLGTYTVEIQARQWDVKSSWTTFGFPTLRESPVVSHREEITLATGAIF